MTSSLLELLVAAKNVYHISCNIEFMVGNIMSDEFLFVKKLFSHFPQAIAEDDSSLFLSILQFLFTL